MGADALDLKWPEDLLPAAECDRQWQRIHPEFLALMQRQRLPETLAQSLGSVVLHLAAWVSRARNPSNTFVLGINGAQGSGKSTLSSFLALALTHIHQQRVAVLSIDDLYKTHDERQRMGHEIHPLLVTRGVPGTHDVAMGLDLIHALKSAAATTVTRLPAFSKAIDDRLPPDAWPCFKGRPDIILFEGWCVGTTPEPESALIEPINRLEREEDRDGRWRRYVNEQLQGSYADLFAQLDGLLMLKVPDMTRVIEWRTQQERQLSTQTAATDRRLLDAAAIERFIMHYERLTRHNLAEMPSRADLVLTLNQQHGFSDVHINKPRLS